MAPGGLATAAAAPRMVPWERPAAVRRAGRPWEPIGEAARGGACEITGFSKLMNMVQNLSQKRSKQLGAWLCLGTLLAGGIVCLIGFQAAFNMAVTTGLLPTKGLPLPFISWGGSALVVSLGLMGIVLSVGLRAQEPVREGRRVAAR